MTAEKIERDETCRTCGGRDGSHVSSCVLATIWTCDGCGAEGTEDVMNEHECQVSPDTGHAEFTS